MIIQVKVNPGSKKQEIKEEDGRLYVSLKEKAENNKANIELINLLFRKYKKPVRIKSGLKSRTKKIEIE